MKRLKAFVRTSKLDETIRRLEDAQAPGISVSSVHGVGCGEALPEWKAVLREIALHAGNLKRAENRTGGRAAFGDLLIRRPEVLHLHAA